MLVLKLLKARSLSVNLENMENIIVKLLTNYKLLNINYIKMFNEFRHKVEFTIFVILSFIAFITPEYWYQWAVLSGLALIILIVGK
jgi:hypothetical protein